MIEEKVGKGRTTKRYRMQPRNWIVESYTMREKMKRERKEVNTCSLLNSIDMYTTTLSQQLYTFTD